MTHRGALALVDEYAEAIGLPQAAQAALPAPGSNRGIDPGDYVRTLVAHFADGGRFLEDVRRLRGGAGFRELIEMEHMPGPDAVGDWLRRMGETGQHVALRRCNDRLVRRYLREPSKDENREDEKATSVPSEGLTLDIDATIIESDKGDGQVAYDGTVGYHPMLGFLSDGRRRPCCSYVQFRPGNAYAQVGIDEAIRHTVDLADQEGRSVQYVRSDSAGYQSDVVDLLEEKSIRYAITAAFDAAVKKAFRSIPRAGWQPLRDRDGFTTGREVRPMEASLYHPDASAPGSSAGEESHQDRAAGDVASTRLVDLRDCPPDNDPGRWPCIQSRSVLFHKRIVPCRNLSP